MRVVLRVLWASPTTLIGLALATLALPAGRIRCIDGAIEAHGPLLASLLTRCVPLRGVAAVTLGHVVLGRSEASLAYSRAHERVHVRQYERWGPFFVPVYLMASVYAAITGGHYYHDNFFEREAGCLSNRDAALRVSGPTA